MTNMMIKLLIIRVPKADLQKNEVFKEIFVDSADLDHFFTLI